MSNLPVAPVELGEKQREVLAIDSSTIARSSSFSGDGFIGERLSSSGRQSDQSQHHRSSYNCSLHFWGASRALSVEERFGDSCEAAVVKVFQDLPKSKGHRLLVVDAGIATHKQFAAASDKNALLGRLRINGKLRSAPPPRPEQPGPGRPKKHGEILHPGWDSPEIRPEEEIVAMHLSGEVRLRRWKHLHFEDAS